MKLRKKLIEVALPLEAINKASAREKSIRHGHPSTLHLWWARRPLAAARAVIFSQMVDDPSEYVDTLKSDPKLLRRAEAELKKRHKVWEEATAALAKAETAGIDAPEPGPEPTLDDILAEQERDRLFKIIEELVLWENTTNETVLESARAEIWQSWRRTCADNADHPRAKELFDRNKLPAFHDPFAGGGALPLEAQRLGLESYASDLNPVAVLINKAMIEIPPKFAGMPPVNPEWQQKSEAEKAMKVWRGAEGLAEDVRYYGKWMRDEAEKRIGHLYPKVEVTEEMAKDRPDLKQYVGKKLTVIAWIWARTVKSPHPAFRDVDVPLTSSFMLMTRAGSEAYVDPLIENGSYRFAVRVGRPNNLDEIKRGTKLSQGSFRCLMSGAPFQYSYIDDEANAGRMGSRLMALVAEGQKGRVYLSPTREMEELARIAHPNWKPETPSRGTWASNAQGRVYGFHTFGDYFTARQLTALTTFADLAQETREEVAKKAKIAGLDDDGITLSNGGSGVVAYGQAVSVYLACALSKMSNIGSSLAGWMNDRGAFRETFARQAIAMAWDYAEANPFADIGGSFKVAIDKGAKAIEALPNQRAGNASQLDAATQAMSADKIVSTDPPYYDNIGYADLSDFFYVWLRPSLKSVYPELFLTLAVPKAAELVAESYRHGGKRAAETFFLEGMTKAMQNLARSTHPGFPVTIYYAFKQSETDANDGTTNTGWDTFLDAVIRAGLAICGTWPVRTEGSGRMIAMDSNALASSIVLVCRKRPEAATTVTRREFVNALKSELPEALLHLQRGNIAPVDLAQAAIGPGMAVYTRFEKVLDAEGNPLTVREALALINQTLDEVLAEQEGDFDADTRFAITWFEQFGFAVDKSGVAEVLATAKATSVEGVADAGIAETGGGNFRLLKPDELPEDWTPEGDKRLTVWDIVHHLIRVLEKDGESAAAALVAKLGAKAETARELCYRLYTMCERKKRNSEALSYNGLVQSWPEIVRLAREAAGGSTQTELFENR